MNKKLTIEYREDARRKALAYAKKYIKDNGKHWNSKPNPLAKLNLYKYNMLRGWKNWSDEEDNYLKENYLIKTNVEISKVIKRSPDSIHYRLQKLRISRPIELRYKMITKEHISKVLMRHPKSQLEIRFETIINQLGLPYKFVGNGEVIVARKVPDFVDSNGKKIAIEVYYKKHKEMIGQAKNIGIEKWKAQRAKVFNENGWEIIYFDENQVNEIEINKVLGGLKNG